MNGKSLQHFKLAICIALILYCLCFVDVVDLVTDKTTDNAVRGDYQLEQRIGLNTRTTTENWEGALVSMAPFPLDTNQFTQMTTGEMAAYAGHKPHANEKRNSFGSLRSSFGKSTLQTVHSSSTQSRLEELNNNIHSKLSLSYGNVINPLDLLFGNIGTLQTENTYESTLLNNLDSAVVQTPTNNNFEYNYVDPFTSLIQDFAPILPPRGLDGIFSTNKMSPFMW